MRPILLVTVFALLPASAPAQIALPVGSLVFGRPTTVAELDMGRLRGEPSRLAWAPDGTELYLQTLEGGFGKPDAKLRHYVLDLATGARKELGGEPEWAGEYWTVKSHQASPDVPGQKIALESERRTERTTSAPMGGDLARGGASPGAHPVGGDAVGAALTSQVAGVHTMRLHGEAVGEFVNSVIVPGLTFGWAPKGARAIAFSTVRSGELVVMDADGRKQPVPGTRETLLPAWSPDAAHLAWLQKSGRRKFLLQVVAVDGK